MYHLQEEVVEVRFVACQCPTVCYKESPGWNLPVGTVTEIHRELKNGLPITDFDVGSGKWTQTKTDFIGQVIYSNEELGVRLSAVNEKILSITYYPPPDRNRTLLCPDCSKQSRQNMRVDSVRSLWFRAYGDIDFDNEKSRLNVFANKLKVKTLHGYIVVYAGCRSKEGEAKARADRAKEYLVREHGLDRKRIKTIDGGRRAEMLVELHLRRRGQPPPVVFGSTYPR
jgi:hypothetical protein